MLGHSPSASERPWCSEDQYMLPVVGSDGSSSSQSSHSQGFPVLGKCWISTAKVDF